ncbi:hypothetical protein CL6EHI_c00100 [Entamoeba histolytica]|uniref:Uncharacterized protein n=1 Tax=Entamoeba histolytica TaxID=5759 RepID=A0A175JNF5_ENTHI|nr:hypothetical protein CL6EHI_c00100 [Entamoeba histolytica]
MENSDTIQQVIDQFVQTPETEGIIYSTYTSSCLQGFREQVLTEIKDDLMKLQIKNNITAESVEALLQKYLDKFPLELSLGLYSEIINFIKNN